MCINLEELRLQMSFFAVFAYLKSLTGLSRSSGLLWCSWAHLFAICEHIWAVIDAIRNIWWSTTDKMGTAQAVVLRRQPFVLIYGHCPTLLPLGVSGEDKELHHRASSVSVCTVYGSTANWHHVLKKLRSTVMVFPVLAPKLLPTRRITRESWHHL